MISPYAVQEFQNCNRQRYLSRIESGGNEPIRISIKAAVDGIVKPALSRLLANPKLGIDGHVNDTLTAYRLMLTEFAGLQLAEHEDARYVQEEIGALIEGILRAAQRVIVPNFQHATVTMPEKVALQLSPEIAIEAGPDVLVEYQGGRCGLFWHTVSTNPQPNLWILRHSIVPAVIAFNLDLVEVRYVKRGERRGGIQGSNLIRSRGTVRNPKIMRKPDKNATRMADTSFPVWNSPAGVKGWIEALPEMLLQEHFGMDWAPADPTNPKLVQYKYTRNSMTLTQMISKGEQESWKIQVNEQEKQIARRANSLAESKDPAVRSAMVDGWFSQARNSCVFCSFTVACDQAISDLQRSGLFRRRIS